MAKLTQTQAGKAFEYSILMELLKEIRKRQDVDLVKDTSYKIAQKYFNKASDKEKLNYNLASQKAVKHLSNLEPNILNRNKYLLKLSLAPDISGITGDVRDILIFRKNNNWEIGISAKNNHKAVKHSRLSDSIDFGKKWFGLNCSEKYFNKINPLFKELRSFKDKNLKWSDISDKHQKYYIPLLAAFKDELLHLDKINPNIVPKKLLQYLLGNKDFYKVIKQKHQVEIQGFNLYGTLNKPSGNIKPQFKIPILKLPTEIIKLDFKKDSTTTLILTCDQGWQISFRIHSASTKVEPSLKFDINLISHPEKLYSHNIHY